MDNGRLSGMTNLRSISLSYSFIFFMLPRLYMNLLAVLSWTLIGPYFWGEKVYFGSAHFVYLTCPFRWLSDFVQTPHLTAARLFSFMSSSCSCWKILSRQTAELLHIFHVTSNLNFSVCVELKLFLLRRIQLVLIYVELNCFLYIELKLFCVRRTQRFTCTSNSKFSCTLKITVLLYVERKFSRKLNSICS